MFLSELDIRTFCLIFTYLLHVDSIEFVAIFRYDTHAQRNLLENNK